MHIYPSLISANLLALRDVIARLDPYCDGYHLDVMDDHFVPNLTWGPDFINAIRGATTRPLNVHLMVEHPASWIKRLSLQAGDCLIFHHEAVANQQDQEDLIALIHEQSWQAGIALNPATPIQAINEVVPFLDQVLIMSVQPGFSGQSFIKETVQKVAPLLAKKKQLNKLFKIGVDGGVNEHNLPQLINEHIDYIAAASSIFGSSDPVAALQHLQQLANKG